MKYLTIIVAVLCVACSEQVTQRVTDIPVTKYYVDGYNVREFRLTDGTRCVLLRVDGGLTCEWRTECQNVEARAQTLEFEWVQN